MAYFRRVLLLLLKGRGVNKRQNFLVKKYCTEGYCGTIFDVCGKVAIVVGGTCGLGYAISNELLEYNAKHVVITGNNLNAGNDAVDKLVETHGKRVSFSKLDQTNAQQFEGVFKKTLLLGGADILVNSDEILRDKNWEREIDINMKAAIQGTLIALKYMGEPNKPNGAVVVNVSSTLGLDGFPYTPIYAGSKAGLIGFTRSIGHHLIFDETGVRVVCLCPGITESEELESVKENQLTKSWGIKAENCLSTMPKQFPVHVAKAAVYVMQNGVSGSVWIIEGGQISRTFIPDRNVISEVVACL